MADTIAQPTNRTHERTVCPFDCPDTCSIHLTIEDGAAVAIRGNPQHEFTQGFLCHKVSRYLEQVYHPDRLLHPLRRSGPKGSGQFEQISWDEAIRTIAEQFRTAMNSPDGPQSILPYSYCGTMGKIQGECLDRRLFHAVGASLLDRTICASAGVAGYVATIGSRTGMAPEEFNNAQTIINWGSNTAETNSHLWVRMHAARRSGSRIITIDPYRSRTAERSDWHLAPRVGTDAALALGMMHIIFREGWEDAEYLDQYCLGVEQLKTRVLTDYDPSQTSELTGLPVESIEQLAHEYAHAQPSAIRINYGVQRHRGGGMAVRTIACLPAVIGAWRHRAGGIMLSTSGEFPLNLQAMQRPDLIPAGTRTINMVELADALAGEVSGPPVNLLFVYCSNPAAVAPDSAKVVRGLKRDELFTVVHEQFHTDTCDYADVILPSTMQPEHFDLHTAYGHHWVQVNTPAIQPPGECRPNSDVFRSLARELKLPPDLFETSDEDLAREALWERNEQRPPALTGITVDSLITDGPQKLQIESTAPFASGQFPTPSGRCEFLSESLAAEGVDPLATFTPPVESPESQPGLAQRYPLQLLTPPSPHFLNSTFVKIDSLRESAGEPDLIMHPIDAAFRGVKSGEMTRIWNDRGEFRARANVSEAAREGVVVARGIWWDRLTDGQGNSNHTTSTATTDLGGGATFFDNLVQVSSEPPNSDGSRSTDV